MILSRGRGLHLIFEAFLPFFTSLHGISMHGNRGLRFSCGFFFLCSKLLLLWSDLGFRKLRAFVFVKMQGGLETFGQYIDNFYSRSFRVVMCFSRMFSLQGLSDLHGKKAKGSSILLL